MKDFYPHAILCSPPISDEAVEGLIRDSLTSSSDEALDVLLIDPLSPTQKDEPSSLGRWRESERSPNVEEEPEKED